MLARALAMASVAQPAIAPTSKAGTEAESLRSQSKAAGFGNGERRRSAAYRMENVSKGTSITVRVSRLLTWLLVGDLCVDGLLWLDTQNELVARDLLEQALALVAVLDADLDLHACARMLPVSL